MTTVKVSLGLWSLMLPVSRTDWPSSSSSVDSCRLISSGSTLSTSISVAPRPLTAVEVALIAFGSTEVPVGSSST